MQNGRLKPCPARPNCVCSQAAGAHYIAPLAFQGSADSAVARLHTVLATIPRTYIVESQSRYLRAESRSRLFGFIDELEFLADPAESVIHVRSAARTGYSDFGVNRRRIENIRTRFQLQAMEREGAK